MNYNVADRSTLTDIQRRNLASIRIKNALIRRQYGDGITISNPLEDVLAQTGPCALPIGAINTNKQLSIYLDGLREELDGTVTELYDKESPDIADGVISLTEALEATADLLERSTDQHIRNKNRKASAAKYNVPKGYKLVKIEDDEEVAASPSNDVEGTADAAGPGGDIGNIIRKRPAAKESAPAAEPDREAAISSLLDLLI